jgi:hypothetical protein
MDQRQQDVDQGGSGKARVDGAEERAEPPARLVKR